MCFELYICIGKKERKGKKKGKGWQKLYIRGLPIFAVKLGVSDVGVSKVDAMPLLASCSSMLAGERRSYEAYLI